MDDTAPEFLTDETTFHERVAATRWGSYISEREEDAVLTASRLAGRPGKVLDIGCEGGRWSILLHRLGWQPVCIDVDSEAVEICSKRLPDADCICMDRDYNLLPCNDGAVDLLLCIEVPPVIYSDWFLPECRRVVKPGGLAVTVFWNRTSIRGRFASWRARRRDAYDYYPQTYREWSDRTTAAGFSPIREEGFCWTPFTRASDSILVRPAVALERMSGLRSLVRYAPWIVSILQRDP